LLGFLYAVDNDLFTRFHAFRNDPILAYSLPGFTGGMLTLFTASITTTL